MLDLLVSPQYPEDPAFCRFAASAAPWDAVLRMFKEAKALLELQSCRQRKAAIILEVATRRAQPVGVDD
jgi:hypothetical protein